MNKHDFLQKWKSGFCGSRVDESLIFMVFGKRAFKKHAFSRTQFLRDVQCEMQVFQKNYEINEFKQIGKTGGGGGGKGSQNPSISHTPDKQF